MLIAIFVIGLGLLIAGLCLLHKGDSDFEVLAIVFNAVGTALMIMMIIPICIGLGYIGTKHVAEERITVYETENLKLETTMANAIEKYLEYEKSIFVEIKPNEAQTYLVAYPELQGSELVKKQLEVLTNNNAQIKALKDQVLDVDVWRFVIYFGR